MNDQEYAIRARNLLTERSEAAAVLSVPRIQAMIPTALNAWTDSCVADPKKRQAFMQAYQIYVSSGSVDLADELPDIKIQDVKGATFFDDGGVNATWLGSRSQLSTTRPVGADAIGLFLDGTILRTVTAAGSLTGTFTLTTSLPVYPAFATDIPVGAEHDFVVYLAMMASRELSASEAIAAAQKQ